MNNEKYQQDFNTLSTDKKMAMKEKISLARDRMIQRITDSKAQEFEKTELTNILIDAAEGTNGLSKEDKLQRVSETVFALANLDAQGVLDRIESAERDRELKESILKLSDKVDTVVVTLGTVKNELSNRMGRLDEKLSKNDEITMTLQKDFEEVKKIKRTKLEVFLDGLRNLRWYWALAAVAITGMIVYKPNVLNFVKNLF